MQADIHKKLRAIENSMQEGNVKIMILGFGSVGSYLLDYLISQNDPNLTVVLVGRDYDKMLQNMNIINVASIIRNQNKSHIIIESNCDFNNVSNLTDVFQKYRPDFVVNSSRVYSGLKYGTISWKYFRAYGIWAPLSIKYIKNIMDAVTDSDCQPIVINTSYSDAVIPWLKSAGKAYPDFGSGNLNHLVPRIKLAIAQQLNVNDFYDIDVTLSTSHFHDVVISKEGQTEGIDVLLDARYKGEKIDVDKEKIFSQCSISMPSDAKRNMMNASSNFNIIDSILSAIMEKRKIKFHTPGVCGELGGYPYIIDGENQRGYIDESVFSLEQMRKANKESIAMDGIEAIEDGCLVYTDALLQKVKKTFNVNLFKKVHFDEINDAAEFLIKKIIEANDGK